MKRILAALSLVLLATAVTAQQLTPYQRQVVGGIKKMLTEYYDKQNAICARVNNCDTLWVEVLSNVLDEWQDAPDYAKYAVDIMEWHSNLAITFSKMSEHWT